MNAGPILSLDEITKSHTTGAERVRVLAGVSLTLARGQALALTGESGSGKSTLLHLAAGLDLPDSGEVSLAGTALSPLPEAGRARLRRRAVGLVFQQFNLIPALDAGANLVFQARLAGREDPGRTARIASRLGLADLLHRYPEELSGGQQQRLAIGRALAGEPALILADEPTGNLDETTGDGVLALMLDLVAETGAPLLFVTHSERLAARLPARRHLSGGRLR